jgi:hypothetical protein
VTAGERVAKEIASRGIQRQLDAEVEAIPRALVRDVATL